MISVLGATQIIAQNISQVRKQPIKYVATLTEPSRNPRQRERISYLVLRGSSGLYHLQRQYASLPQAEHLIRGYIEAFHTITFSVTKTVNEDHAMSALGRRIGDDVSFNKQSAMYICVNINSDCIWACTDRTYVSEYIKCAACNSF